MRLLLNVCLVAAAFGPGRGALSAADPQDEIKRLERENALLKKENDLLNKEVELLKKELLQLKPVSAAPDQAKSKDGEAAKTTREDVEYEFVSIKMDGNVGYMKLAITAKKPDKTLDTQGIRLITADGTEHKAPLIGVIKSNGLQTGRLPEGVRTVVEFKIGQVPSEVKEFATIMLPGVLGAAARERLKNPVVLKGTFKVEK